MKKLLALVMIGLLMMGCEAKVPELTTAHSTLALKDAEVLGSCYEALAKTEAAKAANIASLPLESRGMVIMLDQQGAFAKAMVALATGRSMNPCAGVSTIYDVQIQALKTSGQKSGQVLDATKWIAGIGLTAWGVNSLVDALGSGTSYVLSGDSELNQSSKNTGSFNTAGGDVNTTVSTEIISPEEGEVGETGALPEGTLAECLADPPGGYSSSGTALYTSSLSCNSYYGAL